MDMVKKDKLQILLDYYRANLTIVEDNIFLKIKQDVVYNRITGLVRNIFNNTNNIGDGVLILSYISGNVQDEEVAIENVSHIINNSFKRSRYVDEGYRCKNYLFKDIVNKSYNIFDNNTEFVSKIITHGNQITDYFYKRHGNIEIPIELLEYRENPFDNNKLDDVIKLSRSLNDSYMVIMQEIRIYKEFVIPLVEIGENYKGDIDKPVYLILLNSVLKTIDGLETYSNLLKSIDGLLAVAIANRGLSTTLKLISNNYNKPKTNIIQKFIKILSVNVSGLTKVRKYKVEKI